eukprot:Seg362.1 transcript_id=Seg362.1/GoldUCD/mRNA.D3Y31 product="Opioid growth factor receptor" protein_id=Seg362.1/GoldUCD/D3Y31
MNLSEQRYVVSTAEYDTEAPVEDDGEENEESDESLSDQNDMVDDALPEDDEFDDFSAEEDPHEEEAEEDETQKEATVADPKEEDPKEEVKVADPKEEIKVEDPKEEDPKEEVKVADPKEEVKVADPKEEDSKEEVKVADPKEEVKVEDPKEEDPKEEVKVANPKEEVKVADPKEEVKVADPKDLVKDPAMELAKIEAELEDAPGEVTADAKEAAAAKSEKKEPVEVEVAKKEPVKEEVVKKEPVKKEEVVKEPVQEKEVKKEPAKEEEMKKQPVLEEEVKKEPIQEEEVENEPVKEKKEVKKEPVQEEELKKEPVKEEEIEKDPVEEEEANDPSAADEPNASEDVAPEEECSLLNKEDANDSREFRRLFTEEVRLRSNQDMGYRNPGSHIINTFGFTVVVILQLASDLNINGRIIRSTFFQYAEFTCKFPDLYLKGSVLKRFYHIGNTECQFRCLLHPECKSLNFHTDSVCELNSLSARDVQRHDTTRVTSSQQGWILMSTDYAQRKLGPRCKAEDPCGVFDLCVDTMDECHNNHLCLSNFFYTSPTHKEYKEHCIFRTPTYYGLGCYKAMGQNQTVFRKLVYNLRGRLNWSKLSETVERCATLVANYRGSNPLKYFAIRFYGECWTYGNIDDARYDILGKAYDCFQGTGGSGSNYVYQFAYSGI